MISEMTHLWFIFNIIRFMFK